MVQGFGLGLRRCLLSGASRLCLARRRPAGLRVLSLLNAESRPLEGCSLERLFSLVGSSRNSGQFDRWWAAPSDSAVPELVVHPGLPDPALQAPEGWGSERRASEYEFVRSEAFRRHVVPIDYGALERDHV